MRLTPAEIQLAGHCLALALDHGADKARITLNKSLMDLFGMLDGQVDKVAHALDRSLSLSLFVDGRFGSFSCNRLEPAALEAFIDHSIGMVRMLAPDPARDLPGADRLCRTATEGTELGLYDPAYEGLTASERREMAVRSATWDSRKALEKGFTLLSEEGEYSDSVFDSYVIDSGGLRCRHTETSFEIGYEATVADSRGRRYSGYWWDAAPRLEDLRLLDCSRRAIARAAAQLHPRRVPGGTYTLVVDSECASKLLNPVLGALNASAVQQHNSFLDGRLGQAVFPETLTVMDLPHTPGATGARLFDSEGVATTDHPIIERGTVREYFVNTYMSRKMGIAPTIEDATRPRVLPTGGCRDLTDVVQAVGEGILVTGFNGGNSNSSTGEFSYGIEGFVIRDGAIGHPVREMLITGDFLTLWGHLLIAADDARPCMSRQIPTLAFSDVSFSA